MDRIDKGQPVGLVNACANGREGDMTGRDGTADMPDPTPSAVKPEKTLAAGTGNSARRRQALRRPTTSFSLNR
jgi:hypothetical protein